MRKVLFLPLFQMPSGHHQVADAVMDAIMERFSHVICQKIDCLSYWSKPLEQMISSIYMKWISVFPKQFEKFYYGHVYKKNDHTMDDFVVKKWPIIEYHMKKLIDAEQPDVIVCTHSFPSCVLSGLKEKGIIDLPIINVYTDFLVSDVWGKNGIELHCVPDQDTKAFLQNVHGVKESSIYVTGIPVHKAFLKRRIDHLMPQKHILIAGGNSGLGNVRKMLQQLPQNCTYMYYVLCGKNKKLYQELIKLNHPRIKAVSYVKSREKMNDLYEGADAIVTKAGGVTISEALHKRLPIFIHSSLPGQEQINIEYLKEKELLIPLNDTEAFEQQLKNILENDVKRNRLIKRMDEYVDSLEVKVDRVLADHFKLYRYETSQNQF
ncbi:glycosyltransferase [Priestia megaterium]